MAQLKPRFAVTGLVLWGKRHLLEINLKRAVLGKPNDGVINGARPKEKLHSLGWTKDDKCQRCSNKIRTYIACTNAKAGERGEGAEGGSKNLRADFFDKC